MQARRVVILVFLLVALVAAANLIGRSGWLWALVAGGGFVFGFGRTDSHELLAVGGALVGVAVGLLFGAWGWPGAFPLSVGAGLVTADRIAPGRGAWTAPLGAVLVLMGLAAGVFASGATAATALVLGLLGLLAARLTLRGAHRPAHTPRALPPPPRRHDDPPSPAPVAADR